MAHALLRWTGVRRVCLLALVLGCAVPSEHERYLGDRDFRRAAMAEELVDPANTYSRTRLAHYGSDWDDLPIWNPTALDVDISPDDPDALRRLGEQAFYGYPAQLWHGPGDHVIRVETAAGERAAGTCATCHESAGIPGLANATLDLGWGAGRVDVTTLDGSEPVKIPDLRPVRFLDYLHADATVRQRDEIALAIRIETLIVTSHHETVRPPPVVALALAMYVWSLAPAAPPPPSSRAEQHGAALFAARCAGCHAPPNFTGVPVDLARVGTDPAVGLSRDRGTGMYRVPSLRGACDRALLLHDGSVHSLGELLDPARESAGHRFGTTLSAADRDDLAAYVTTL